MVRIARQSNTSMLIPNFTSLSEAPFDLVMAIQHAHTILSWHENLPEDEIPERWMWAFPDEINEWFDEIKEIRRQEKEERGRGGDDREIVPMTENAWRPGDEL